MTQRLKRTAALLQGSLLLSLLAACSSPPELPQVTCCTQRPVNSPEWVQRKTLEHEERMRLRNEARKNYIREGNQAPDEIQLVEELKAADEFAAMKDREPAAQEEASNEELPSSKRGLVGNKSEPKPSN